MCSKVVKLSVCNSVLLAFNIIVILLVTPVYAEPDVKEDQNQYYVGTGLGYSFLQPTTNSTTFTLVPNNDLAFKGLAGYQFDNSWSTELFWSYLGVTKIRSRSTGNDVGSIEYQSFGAGGMYQYPVNNSWKAFAKAGIGMINHGNSYDGFISGGVGVIWNIDKSWDLRAEYDFYNRNMQLLSFNVVKHFGSVAKKSLVEASSAIVKQKTCEGFIVNFKNITFAQGTPELSKKSKQSLDKLALQLLTLPEDIKFEIRAHADEMGTKTFNYQLSLMRSRIVRDYLAKKGIPLSRMDAQGFGEWLAKKGNNSPSTREQNRRAELKLVGIEKYVEDTRTCVTSISSTDVTSVNISTPISNPPLLVK